MIYDSILFGICLTIASYWGALLINKKFPSPLTNPLLLAMVLCTAAVELFSIPYESFMKGGSFINAFILPATAVLGLSIYRNFHVFRANCVPILLGSAYACFCSMGSVWVLCKLFHVRTELLVSLLPKSVTTAVAIDISHQMGGIVAITLLSVFITGLLGALLAPVIIKHLKMKNTVALGVAMGSTCHAVGTITAMKISEVHGAISGLCIGTAGIITSVIIMFVMMFSS